MTEVVGQSDAGIGVLGESQKADGVRGVGHDGAGVSGTSDEWIGVYGESQKDSGVRGVGHDGAGVSGTSDKWIGVYGESQKADGVRGVGHDGAGVSGTSDKWIGVFGRSTAGEGVHGETNSPGVAAVAGIQLNPDSTGAAVFGAHPGRGPGGWFRSETGEGVHGETKSPGGGAVVGIQLNPNPSSGVGVYGEHVAGGTAGFFKGNVIVTGDVQLAGADLAEEFGVVGALAADPGCVVVLAGDDRIRVSDHPYDRRVAGVVSGAGSYRPALVLDRQADADRRPLALTGKVWCKVDADSGPIELGDMLTTSSTPGHAMRAADPARAFGAVIGKALGGLASGRGLLPVLVALQ